LFAWRKLAVQGALTAIASQEEVVPARAGGQVGADKRQG
jgi:hypothetical protein